MSKFGPPSQPPPDVDSHMGSCQSLLSHSFLSSFFTFFAGDLQVDNNESPGCAHLIPSGRGEKHHGTLGILCLKMVICQLEQILGEQRRWRVDRFHLLYLLNLITGTGLQRGKNILLCVIWKEAENMVEIRQRQPPNHSVSVMLGIPGSTTTFILCDVALIPLWLKKLHQPNLSNSRDLRFVFLSGWNL